MKRLQYWAVAGCVCLAAAAVEPGTVHAQGGVPDCKALSANPDALIYMAGTTAVLPVIRLLGARLKRIGVTLLWNESSEGCSSVNRIGWPNENLGTNERAVFTQYDEVAAQPGKVASSTCNGQINQIPDLVINDVAWSSCLQSYNIPEKHSLPTNIGEFAGPVQGLVPIVATSYTYYNDVTAEELEDLYECGAAGSILTFTNNSFIYDYDRLKSGMPELWSRGIGIANGSLLSNVIAVDNTLHADSIVDRIAGSGSPDVTIGYTSTEFYDQFRDRIRALKVRGVGQAKAYWPDLDITTTDKINIREGRYTLQGNLRLVAQVDASGKVVKAGARHMVDWFQGNPPESPDLKLPFDVVEVYATRGVVPQCAMKVSRDGDLPVFKHYTPAQPCHCDFQVLATGNASIEGCVPCKDATTCQAGQQCSYGYCE